MSVQVKATIQGHPWDLWGLARIFDGRNEQELLVEATEPVGKPAVNFNDRNALERFQRSGYARLATLSGKDLTWPSLDIDLDEAADRANALVKRINGIAKLLDPEYYGVRLISVAYSAAGGQGAKSLADWTPNKGYTNLGRHPSQSPAAVGIVDFAKHDRVVGFVLEAFNLPISWASLYLIYDCIAGTVGGTKALARKGWVPKRQLDEFAYSANSSREISLGIRHGASPDARPPKPTIPLHEGHGTIMRLTLAWLHFRIAEAAEL